MTTSSPPRQVRLAALLAEGGASFVVVGGTARHLRGDPRRPRDLDVVVLPGALDGLAQAVTALGGSPLRPGPSPRRVDTPWSPVDVFVEDDLPAWTTVAVGDVELRVADG